MNLFAIRLILSCIALYSISVYSLYAEMQVGQIKALRVYGQVYKTSTLAPQQKDLVEEGMLIDQQDVIETQQNSSVILLFSNGSALTLGANTKLVINTFLQESYDTQQATLTLNKEPSISKTDMTLEYGHIIGNVKKLNTALGSSYTIQNTAIGIAGIRGTMYEIKQNPPPSHPLTATEPSIAPKAAAVAKKEGKPLDVSGATPRLLLEEFDVISEEEDNFFQVNDGDAYVGIKVNTDEGIYFDSETEFARRKISNSAEVQTMVQSIDEAIKIENNTDKQGIQPMHLSDIGDQMHIAQSTGVQSLDNKVEMSPGKIKVLTLSGEVTYIDPLLNVVKKINQGMDLFSNLTLQTDFNSSAVIEFANGAVVCLAENTRLFIKEFLQIPHGKNDIEISEMIKEPSVSKTSLLLLQGQIVGKVKTLNIPEGSFYIVQNPIGGIANIQGTTYVMKADENPAGNKFEILNGSALYNVDIKNKTSIATPGNGFYHLGPAKNLAHLEMMVNEMNRVIANPASSFKTDDLPEPQIEARPSTPFPS